MKWNLLRKEPYSRSSYVIIEGNPLFDESVYLIKPIIQHKNSPSFVLTNRGKYVCGLFKIPNTSVYSGDWNSNLLIVLIRNSEEFEILKSNLPVDEGRISLLRGELNNQINKARSLWV